MKALNLHGIRDLRLENVPVPVPAEDEVLLKVLAAGICGSDVPRIYKNGVSSYPTIIGHEFVGEVVMAGANVEKSLLGKRATVFPILPCFTCGSCRDENYAACLNYNYYGSRRDGAFAEYVAVKAWNLMLVPDSIPDEWAAMTEPCAVAVHAFEKAGLRKGDIICIFGAGAIGLILAQLARSVGATVILLDIDEKKLDFARREGFEHAYDTRDDDYFETVHWLTKERGADVCFEVAGVGATIGGCLSVASPFATIILVGNPHGDILLLQEDYWQILRKQLSLVGTWNSDFGGFENNWKTALQLMEDGTLDLSGLITHVFPLEEADAAFDLLRDRNEFYVKIMFSPHSADILETV